MPTGQILKGPVEGLERLADAEPAEVDAALDPALPHVAGGLAKDALEQDERGGVVLVGPREVSIDVRVELLQSESVEVVSESVEEPGVSARLWLGSSSGAHGFAARCSARRGLNDTRHTMQRSLIDIHPTVAHAQPSRSRPDPITP